MPYGFDALISLADETAMQSLIGRPALQLVGLLDDSVRSPTNMRRLLLRMRPPSELLADCSARAILFDLLPQENAEELAGILGLDQSSAYESLRSLRFAKGSAAEGKIETYFGVQLHSEEASPESPSSMEVSSAAYPLWEFQRSVARRALVALETEPRRLLIHMPTGSGKTRTTMHLIARHLARHEPTLVLWLAYSDELCEQAASEFQKAWVSLGDREVTLARFWGSCEPNWDDVHDGLVVAGLSKTYARGKQDLGFIARLADRTSLVIIDEAHQAVAETYRLVLETVFSKQPDTALLGLTATPGRSWADMDEDARLANFFARRKVGIDVEGYSNPVDFLIEEKFLARPTFESLMYSGGLELSAEDERKLNELLDIPERILKALAEDAKRNLMIVMKMEMLLRHHKRVLLFAATVEHARLLAAVLGARGHAAWSVTTQSGAEDRRRIIAEFRSDDDTPMVICNYGVLTTGFDAPRTSAVLVARPTKSLVLYLQMVGRALRGLRAGGNSSAEVVTVVDQGLPGFRDIGEAFMNWEDVWS